MVEPTSLLILRFMLTQCEFFFPNFIFVVFSILYGFTLINIGRYLVIR